MTGAVTQSPAISYPEKGVVEIFWEGVGTGATDGGTGAFVDGSYLTDRSFQCEGTFAGATMFIEGSNDTRLVSLRTAFTLSDAATGTKGDLRFNADGIGQVLETTHSIRPRIVAGTATTMDVDVRMIARSTLR